MWIFILAGIMAANPADRLKSAVSDGNNIRTRYFNMTTVGGPDRFYPWPRLEWPAGSGHEYLYQSGLIIGANVEAVDTGGHPVRIWIFDDGILDGGDVDFLPITMYSNPASETLSISTNPSTWPSEWPSYRLAWGDAVAGLSGQWPGEFGAGRVIADQEGFFVMSDSANTEYYPGNPYGNPSYDPGNGMKGLGLVIYGRSYVIDLDGIGDAVIYSYTIYNAGAHPLDSIVVGIMTDATIGGPGGEFDDDVYDFNSQLNTMRFSDEDGTGRNASGQSYPCGQMAIVLLQSPGNSSDGIDNDGDGMVDESPYDNIDNDGDWDPQTDDVGRDGIPNTGDEGENDGIPTWGEPNFDWRDPDEVDELGLTAVDISRYGTYLPSNDLSLISRTTPGHFSSYPQLGNYITLGSSGYFSLQPGQWTKLVYAYVMSDGQSWDELWPNWIKTVNYYREYLGIGERGDSVPSREFRISAPSAGDRLRGSQLITWETDLGRPLYARIVLGKDGFRHSYPLANLLPVGEDFSWCTRDWPDGSLYQMAIMMLNPLKGGAFDTTGFFTIDNPEVDGVPSVMFADNIEEISGTYSLTIVAGDAERDTFTVKVLLSTDDRSSWHEIFRDILAVEREYLSVELNSTLFPNTRSAYLMAVTEANNGADTAVIGPFAINNPTRLLPPGNALRHIKGSGEGDIFVSLRGTPQTSDTFMMTFNSTDGQLRCSVKDITIDSVMFENYPVIDWLETPIFDNMSLIVNNFHDTTFSESLSGHVQGNSNFSISGRLANRGVKTTSDHIIEFFDERVGHAYYNDFLDTVDVNFVVIDTCNDDTVMPLFVDMDRDTVIANPDGHDAIVILKGDTFSWIISFYPEDRNNPIPPQGGDIYTARILNPITEIDTFLLIPSELPYVEESSGAIHEFLSMERSVLTDELSLQFNLQWNSRVDIKIIDAAGRVLRSKQLTLTAGHHIVNLSTRDLPSGIYFVSVRADNARAVRKFVRIRQ